MARLPRLAAVLLSGLLLAAGLSPAHAADEVQNVTRPNVRGEQKYGKTLTRWVGKWSPSPTSYRTQWLRDGKPIGGATGITYTLTASDVGHHVTAQVFASRSGYRTGHLSSARTQRVGHLTAWKRTVTYSVQTRGSIRADLDAFKRQAQESYDDARGWRSNGTAFKRVASGGQFTLVLAQASKVPSFSSACSAQWSCRVGRYVVINQDRWLNASASWNRAGGSLRNYRHMVVNHETGHWLGWGHRSCGGAGWSAPVMQQQSKGLQGCRFNPWPLPSERNVPRYSSSRAGFAAAAVD